MKNILVAIDFSNATDAVIHQIGKLACPNDSIIHLLHIVEPVSYTHLRAHET